MGYYGRVFDLLNGFLDLFRPIPPLAWVPLVLTWFRVASMATLLGLQMGKWYVYLNNLKLSMIFIIFIGYFYPILTSSIHGVRNVKKTLLDSARVLGASQRSIFLNILSSRPGKILEVVDVDMPGPRDGSHSSYGRMAAHILDILEKEVGSSV